jgi:arylsulfatase A-like enzyme
VTETVDRLPPIFRVVIVVVAACLCGPSQGSAADQANLNRPNILWITAEDMSPTLGCYGDQFATSPNIDRLASQSVRYTHAFATAPVCSPSRACLINGCIATTQGTHPMRSLFPLPKQMTGFPALLRRAGYYTTNNVKTDYNSAAEPAIIAASWDDSSDRAHWRGRAPDQPFFSIFNLMTTHQSRTMVWPYDQFVQEVQSKLAANLIHDSARVPLPPYYPDTPLVRKTVARYYDCVCAMDQQVGEILRQLEDDGLADNTIVFFYSDHGSGMPRHKRALFDSGMQIPLLIRFPTKFGNLAPAAAGETVGRLVNFEDFGPTVLSLAGIDALPGFIRGRPFLAESKVGANAKTDDGGNPREYLFGHRDRVDEIMDMARSVRSRDFLYIRNFMPHLGYNQQSAWIDQGLVRKDFYALADSGDATAAQAQYLRAWRPREELYDCVRDPLNLKNLAASPEHQSLLIRMRQALRRHMIQSRDLGLVPEIELWKHSVDTTPMQWAQTGQLQIESLLAVAELVGTDDFDAIGKALGRQDASARYWAAVSCSAAKSLPTDIAQRLSMLLEDESWAVRIEAADAVARHIDVAKGLRTLVDAFQQTDQTVVLHAARKVELLGHPSSRAAMQRLADRYQDEPGDIAWFIRFSTSGYLSRMANQP